MHELIIQYAATEARHLARKWPAVESADIRQEILLWALERPEIDAAALAGDGEGLEAEEARKSLRFRLRDAGAQYCRKQERNRRRERAAVRGYETADEAFYSLGQLRGLVEAYFAHGVTERPPLDRADSVKRVGDPAEGGLWTVSLLDVQRGLTLIPTGYLRRLWDRFGEHAHLSDEEYGWVVGLTEAQVRGRMRTALRAVQRELGGANPWQKGPARHDQHATA